MRKDGQLELKCPPKVKAPFYENRTPEVLDGTLPSITWPVLLLTTINPGRCVGRHPGAPMPSAT